MNSNTIEYITHKIINGDVSLVPTKEWHHNVEADLRNTWLPRVGSFENVVTAISYKKDAIYCTLFRKVKTSRDGDFQFVCLHIPYFMILDLDTMVVALEKLKAYVKGCEIQMPEDSTVGSIVNEIKVINNTIVPPASYMQGTGYAYRQVGGVFFYKYSDIIKGQYQSEYNKYGVLFILDENESPVGIDKGADLTDKKIHNYIWFSKSDLVGLGDNVTVYCGDMPFDSPIRVESNGTIPLTFKKKGFEDQKHNISVADGKVKMNSWIYKVTKEMFDVRDEKTRNPIPATQIYMGGRSLPADISESNLKNDYDIKISAEGYMPATAKVRFSPGMKLDTITMKQKPIEYYIQLTDGHFVRLDYTPTEKKKRNESPVNGYIIGNSLAGVYNLIPDVDLIKDIQNKNKSSFKKFLRIFLPIFLMLFVCWAGFVAGHILSEKNNSKRIAELETEICILRDDETLKKEPALVEEKQKKDEIIEAANAYLSKNPKWNREAMEQIEPLKGVWDALNTYDYNKIMEVDGLFHFESTEWKKIITAIKAHEYMRRVGDVPICGDGDTELTISDANSANTYLGRINSAPTPKTGTTKAANTSAKKKAPEKKEEKLPDPKSFYEEY